MTPTREFPTRVIASASTGVLLCDFEAVHEAGEYLMGHPIWMHQLPSLHAQIQRAVLAQHPDMPPELPGVNRTNYRQAIADIEAQMGKTVKIKKGNGARVMHLMEGIPDGKPVVVMITE